MNTFASRVRNRRMELGMTQNELADKLGYVSRSSVAKLEAGVSDLPRSKIELLAEMLDTTPAYLMGWTDDPKDFTKSKDLDNPPTEWPGNFDDEKLIKAYRAMHEPPAGLEPMPPRQRLPVIGSIACGIPILAEQNIEEYLSLPVDGLNADFILRCKGDSMIDARIADGDLAFIRIQPEVNHGEIAAIQIDDETATLKRFLKYPNQIVLMPANAAYEPMIFTGEEMARVHVVGKAVGFLSLFN